MTVRRLFYVTQESLQVWSIRRSHVSREASFQGTDEGFQAFEDYLCRAPQESSRMLVDVIEEEFALDKLPKLARRDQRALIGRKMQRKFPSTPYRLGIEQGRSQGEVEVLYSALSNPELVKPWLDLIARRRTPLTGVYSVSMLGATLLSKLKKPATNALFLTPQQGSRLRQVFLKSGHLKSSRLSQPPPMNRHEFGAFMFTEVQRSRRYLERTRLLRPGDPLDVYLIADEEIAAGVTENSETTAELRLHFIQPIKAFRSLNLSTDAGFNHIEALYLGVCARRRPKFDYAPRAETAYSRMLLARQAAIVTAVTASVACSIFSGIYLIDGLRYRVASGAIELQIRHMEETYRRENEKFRPIKADSHEMKLAVDTGDFILDNKLPVAWVLQQLGLVLGGHPDIHIDELTWRIEGRGAQQDGTPNARRDPSVPVAIAEIAAVRAVISGQISPYDGDLREAFRKIDALIESLRTDTAFESVVATHLPIDPSPSSALTGEISRKTGKPVAHFRLNLALRIDGEQT